MNLTNKWKLLSLFITFASIAVFWNDAWIQPLKLIVVFFHEISHAIGALLTGGKVESILIFWDESGYTITQGGHFLTIASAGYIGCILWGSSMLFVSLSGRLYRYFSIALGLTTALFILNFSPHIENQIYFLILAWSFFFVTTGILFTRISRYSLFYMGGLTSLYGLFDLFDFFRGSIDRTDAGKIAGYYTNDPTLSKLMAYAIGLLISIVSVWILYKIVMKAISQATPVSQIPEEDNSDKIPIHINPELLRQLREIADHQASGS